MRSPDPARTAPAALLGLSAAALLLVLGFAAAGGVAQVVPGPAADVPGVGEAPWGAWSAETVHKVGRDPTALALQSDGDPVIGYWSSIASGAPAAFLAERNGATGWDHGPVTGAAQFHDFTLDDQDRAHLVYENLTNWPTTFEENVTYAFQRADGSWHREKISDSHSSNSKIALTPNGEPRITIGKALTLRYLKPTPTGWTSTEVSNNGVAHDLAIDSTGTPHIAFGRTDNTGGVLGYATKLPNGTWHVNKTVLNGCGQAISIATGPQDRPHIACHLINGNGLEYVWQDADGEWHHETADDGSGPPFDRASGRVGWNTDIAVDAEGEPHISYEYFASFGASAVFPGKAHYASKVDGSWVVETIDHDGQQQGLSTSIELDAEGRPHVSYVLLERFQQGFPGSGKLNTQFDIRYARPAQADGLNAVDAAAPDASTGETSNDGGAGQDLVVPPLVGKDAAVSGPNRAASPVGGSGLMP